MNLFKKDKFHLLKYFVINSVVFGVMCFLLIHFKTQTFIMPTLVEALAMVVLGLVLGLVSATAFHNASHGNIKPRILNTIVGELTASFSLEDIRCFKVGHMLHHIHSDDPVLDPHPPVGLSFMQFIAQSRQKTIYCITQFYFKNHGKSPSSERNVLAQIIVFHVAAILKLVFLFLAFGPVGFLFFYIPSYLSYFFGFAHLNYISHKEQDQTAAGDDLIIYNHDEGVFYKIMNVLTSGGYFHKNHHLYPGLYNPSKATTSKTVIIKSPQTILAMRGLSE